MNKLLLIVLILATSVVVTTAQTTAFVGVNVIPMDRERLLANQTVIVRKGVIAEIGDARKSKGSERRGSRRRKGPVSNSGSGRYAHAPAFGRRRVSRFDR